jgi:hypothetical protein
VPNASKLPAVKGRQMNFDKLAKNQRIANARQLADVRGVDLAPQQLTLFTEPSKKPARKTIQRKSQ